MCRLVALWLLLVAAAASASGNGGYVALPGGMFRSVLKYDDQPQAGMRVAPFVLMTRPVTNAEFLAFVQSDPRWRRDRVPRVFADAGYLAHWGEPSALGPGAQPQQPVVRVSWFAASAYCQAKGARLPTWSEWEYAAAADERRRDARHDPIWRRSILDWYARPSREPLPRVGLRAVNAYGVQDLHGLVWEWTEDFSALLIDADNRNQGDADTARFCGAGALAMDDRDNYAVLMRVAMLSALDADDTTLNMGFRCAKDPP